jgi:hypothetical protein
MNRSLQKWLSVALFNLLLVAVLGGLMRYKIAFSFPIVNQKFLLHAHSHFAFTGWVTQALMVLLVNYLVDKTQTNQFARYRWLLWANLITAYGMLATFPFEGYALGSIIFSTASIFISYAFAIQYWRDLNKIAEHHTSHSFFRAAIFFNALSSIGAFSLAYMMATKSVQQNSYLASVYFFLHFQYNGWFLFSCMGLLAYRLNKYGIPENKLKPAYYLFAGSCIPAYFLSAMWIAMPEWVYVLVALSGLAQLAGWFIFIRLIRQVIPVLKTRSNLFSYRFFILCGIAYSLKLLLQASTAIPSLSELAYGFRPIVIGYLHLVLLGVVSMFIIAYCIACKFITFNNFKKTGTIIFVAGIIINEIFLMVQGVADLKDFEVPYINESLLGAAIILFLGILLMNINTKVATVSIETTAEQ